jgi:hypothetical protein
MKKTLILIILSLFAIDVFCQNKIDTKSPNFLFSNYFFGNIRAYDFKYENDSCTIWETYLNNNKSQVYERTIDFKNHSKSVKTYYPDSEISISDCSIGLGLLYGQNDTTSVFITNNLSDKSVLVSFEHTNPSIKIYDKNFQKIENIQINPRDKEIIHFTLNPDRYEYDYPNGRVSLITLKANKHEYSILVHSFPKDISEINIHTLKEFHIKKIENKKLIVCFGPIQNHNTYRLTKFVNKEERIVAEAYWLDTGGYGIMDLTKVMKGTYMLHILCDTIRFKIKFVIE